MATIVKEATISPCETYRYRLTRKWGPGPMLPFVMLNPSTADASIDDPTIRRCMGFARRERADGIVVCNLYGLRSPSPKDLLRCRNPIGPDNDQSLADLAMDAEAANMPIVCAWGAFDHLRAHDVVLMIQSVSDAPLMCLGKTKAGHPRHPLYVKGDQPLEVFA